jgi:hypothetical protein
VVSACGSGRDSATALPEPADTGIDHVVVVMMENRSFRFVHQTGTAQDSFHLAPSFQNCHFADPDHSYGGGARREINGGAMDGVPADAAARRHVSDRLLDSRQSAVLHGLRRELDGPRPLLQWHPRVDHRQPEVSMTMCRRRSHRYGPPRSRSANDGRLGCRVPCVIIGPPARRSTSSTPSSQLDAEALRQLARSFGL